MKLILKGFRCYPDHVFEFPDGLITLLKGPSGCGKSTLFSAIFWCLYRSLKHVSSHSGQKRCSVTLEFYRISLDNHNVWEKIAIYRQKNPHLLQIRCFSSLSNSDPVSIYEDEVAQNLIHQISFSPPPISLKDLAHFSLPPPTSKKSTFLIKSPLTLMNPMKFLIKSTPPSPRPHLNLTPNKQSFFLNQIALIKMSPLPILTCLSIVKEKNANLLKRISLF